jgi:hypothetical protein
VKPISTQAHAVISYTVSGTLLVAPKLLAIEDVPAAARAPRVAGATAGLYSLFTDFELGAMRLLPMPAHLALDAVGGALLATAPWLAGFAREGRRYWVPHVAAGASVVMIAALTRPRPPSRRTLLGR